MTSSPMNAKRKPESYMICFLTKILPSTFLSREALSDRRNRQTMDFKLPHDVVCACAKRDEPPSRRRPSESSSLKIHVLPTTASVIWPTSARHLRFFRVFSGLQKIRVHSCEFVVDNQRFGCGKSCSKCSVVPLAYSRRWT